ncbi:MAG: DNA-directed RNA polymerase subunit L [Candidatus Aenigmatarchaeota archaeon]
MEFKILREEENVLLIEFINESETFLNLLREELWNIKGVIEAAYIKEHPELSNPKLWIKTENISAREALKSAINNLIEKFEKLREGARKIIK